MAVTVYFEFGDLEIKRKMEPDTPLAELKQTAIDNFEIKDPNPVIMYYDDDDEKWFKVGKRGLVDIDIGNKPPKVQLKVVLCDDNGKIIDDKVY